MLSTGRNSNVDNYTAQLKRAGKVTAIRLEALTDPSLVKKSLARGNGNFVLTDFSVKIGDSAVKIASAKADFEQTGHPAAAAIDADKKSGWAGNGHVEAKNRAAVFIFAEPVELAENQALTVEMRHESGYAKHAIGRFRLSLSDVADPGVSGGVDAPLNVQQALKIAKNERDSKQTELLSAHFRGISPELAETRNNLETWRKRLETVEKSVQTMLVSEPLNEPRMMRILPRGNWLDDSGEVVEPAIPAFFPGEQIEGRRATRLDLANWVVADTNPLTARTFVNRLWKLFFGAGISKNLDDLGGQGVPPSHPELLDWLAVEFRENGWDVKHMIRLILSSAAYQQTSVETAAMRQADPGNQWLTRQGRWRLEAEFVRDTALDLSGLLVHQRGGKSVKPYQPAGYWQHLNFPRREWKSDAGQALYRRGLYTFWCRSFLHPAMLAFDAPSREECTAERPRSNIPQQALVLLNDPVFVEAARVFGAKIAKRDGDSNAKIRWAWEMATSRAPSAEESRILAGVFENQRAKFAAEAESAAAVVSVGSAPAPEDIDAAELAAWAQVARTILNAYETTARN